MQTSFMFMDFSESLVFPVRAVRILHHFTEQWRNVLEWNGLEEVVHTITAS